jgi:hypothetical protein
MSQVRSLPGERMKKDKRGIPYSVRYEQLKQSHNWLVDYFDRTMNKIKVNHALRQLKRKNSFRNVA